MTSGFDQPYQLLDKSYLNVPGLTGVTVQI